MNNNFIITISDVLFSIKINVRILFSPNIMDLKRNHVCVWLYIKIYRIIYYFDNAYGSHQWHGGGGAGGQGFFFFFLLVSSAVSHGHDDITPTPL